MGMRRYQDSRKCGYCAYILFLALSYRTNGRLNNSHYLGKRRYFHSLDETLSWNIDIRIHT